MLDGLEAVVAEQGRGAADEVLAAVCERLVARLRATDVVGRWGSHELTVLLAKVNEDDVAVVAVALVEILNRTGTERVAPGSLSAAIGVALAGAEPGGNELVDRAARAVAEARALGGGWAVAAR